MKQIPCFKHDGSYLLFIKFDKSKTKYVCDECCLEWEEQQIKDELLKLIHIKRAIRSPEQIISKFNLLPYLSEFFTNLDKYDDNTMNSLLIEFQTQCQNIQNALQGVYKELEQNIKCILEMKDKIRKELKTIIKFDQFLQIRVNLEQLGDSINQQAIEQNEQTLHKYLQELTKNDCQELNKNIIDMLDRIRQEPKDLNEEQYPQYRKLEEQIKQINLYQHNFALKNNLICFFQFGGKLMSYQQSQKIMNVIQLQLNKKVLKFQQVYFGTRDGLSSQAFWNKVNGKSNLLMVFKSQIGYIFGGFSPCKWQQNVNSHVSDDTLSSFLFSQTHDQIYPLKEQKNNYAIYCHVQYGPCFGGSYNGECDLYINGNFQGCTSALGDSYKYDHIQDRNYKMQLFGQFTTKIEECEIYQVIFA